MTGLTITHQHVSAIADDPVASAAGQMLPSDWNNSHNFTGTLPIANGGTGAATAAAAFTALGGLPTASGYVYNPAANNLPKFRAALAKVLANGGNAHVLWVGTSTVDGYATGGVGAWDKQYTLEQQLAVALTNAYGIPANNDSIFGYTGAGFRDSNSLMVVGAGWGADTVYSIGGPMFTNNSDTSAIVFTLPDAADKVKIYYPTDNSGSPTLGTFSYKINSGSTTNVNQGTSAPAVASVTINVTPAAGNTLTIARVSGTVKFIGMEPYLSTKSTVNIINSGVGGVIAGSFNDGSGKAYATNTAWNAVSPDLTIIQMDNNDAISSTALATYKSNITSIINGANNGDTLIVAQVPYGALGGTVSNLPPYITAQQQVALASSVPFLDQTLRIPSYDNFFTPNGLSMQDGLHANVGGYLDQGQFLIAELMTIAGYGALYKQFSQPIFNGNLGGGIYGIFAGSTQVGWANHDGWILGPTAGSDLPQGVLKVSGVNYTNGTAQGGVLSLDSTTGGATQGAGGGFVTQFIDNAGVNRAGAAYFSRKYDAVAGNIGSDAIISSRPNGGASVDMLKLSATDGMSTFVGNVTATTFVGALTGNASTATSATSATTATNATNSAITNDTSTNATMFPVWVTANTGNLPLKVSSTKVSFNPSTGILTATGFSGALTGNVTGNVTGSSGSCTGNSATVTTNANLTGGVTSVGNAATVVTNANLTGPITSVGNATSIASQTGTGTKFVVDTTPTLVTPILGVATGTGLILTGSSANILTAGLNGSTNPAFNVDASVSTIVGGISVTGSATGVAPTIQTITSDTNGAGIGMTIKAKSATATGKGGGIAITAGNGSGTGGTALGGSVTITGGSSNTGDSTTFNGVDIEGGTATSGAGGDIKIMAGSATSGFHSGAVTISGADGLGAAGGTVTIKAGGSNTSQTGVDLNLTGGAGGTSGAQAGGRPVIKGGTGNAGGAGGAVMVTGGTGGATGAGGAVTIAGGVSGATSGDGGAVTLTGGLPPTSGNGGAVSLSGAAGVGTSKNGGNVNLTPGNKTSGGTDGVVAIAKLIVRSGTGDTIAAGTGAGTSPTIAIAGPPQSGTITLTTGTLPTLSATIATVTYSQAAPTGSIVVISPANSNAALLTGAAMVYAVGTTTAFTVTAGATALTAATQYIWNYTVTAY